ncbi:DNA integration/recombination/inversion protein [Vagococcus penaei]|uniref:Epoxyqueuosine reductase QueH n=1 Tax=Vagococcus penaei TaxID=633807 RepID=A0A1Q2D4A1_9ENTE|nr:epoxyqueuosine reductase QueH [Vagococcus penaei]AQP53202.1 DNA integration/recombination/inversion protein [Vagococcus penaei]RSU01004.1 DNA integration/recombination/inversion protein [Vagococcus penaei]
MLDAAKMIEKLTNQTVNYDSVLRKVIKDWQNNNQRPKILLHSCCAPCSTYTLEFLTDFADVTIYFANSNIYPRSEYLRRAKVQQEFISQFNYQTGKNVGYIEADYQPNEFIKMVQAQGLQNEPEKGKRCTACFQMRLDLVADEALTRGFDYFGSALTISPQKNAQLINQIGLDVQKIYQVNYLPSDFKKNGGYQRSIEMCRTYDIYRQCYCGCVFAAKQQEIDLKVINQEAKKFNENRMIIE